MVNLTQTVFFNLLNGVVAVAGVSKKTSVGGVGNKIYNSPMKELAWLWLSSGQSPSQVQRALAEHDLDVSLPVVYNFREIMSEEEERSIGNSGGVIIDPSLGGGVRNAIDAVPDNLRIRNDGEVLDLVIQKFATQLKDGNVTITPAVALKAIDMKKSMLGTQYKGQTVWSLMESQMQFDRLSEVINKYVTHEQFEKIMEEMDRIGAVTTERPTGVASAERIIDSELEKELLVEDPVTGAGDIEE